MRTPHAMTRPLRLALLVFMVGGQTLLYSQAVDRSSPPSLGATPSMHLPPITQFRLSNGLDVTMMEKHDVDRLYHEDFEHFTPYIEQLAVHHNYFRYICAAVSSMSWIN